MGALLIIDCDCSGLPIQLPFVGSSLIAVGNHFVFHLAHLDESLTFLIYVVVRVCFVLYRTSRHLGLILNFPFAVISLYMFLMII